MGSHEQSSSMELPAVVGQALWLRGPPGTLGPTLFPSRAVTGGWCLSQGMWHHLLGVERITQQHCQACQAQRSHFPLRRKLRAPETTKARSPALHRADVQPFEPKENAGYWGTSASQHLQMQPVVVHWMDMSVQRGTRLLSCVVNTLETPSTHVACCQASLERS